MIPNMTGRTIDELGFRLRQYVWNTQDRLRLMCNRAGNYRQGSDPVKVGRFFIDQEEHARIRDVYALDSALSRCLLVRADALCAHRFDLLGFSALCFDKGGGINWHYDPVNGVELARHWWQEMLDPAAFAGADPKVVWELNRQQHLVTLAQAYVISSDERYRTEIVSQLRDWMDANPPKYGVNWTSSLELAYRSIAWLWTWFLCGGGAAFGSLTSRFVEFLALHADHIEHNLSVYYSPNTHLTGESLGLYYIGTLLPELQGARRWRDTGRTWLLKCLDEQVLADGGYMERTMWYHRYTIDIYLHFYLLSLKNGDALPESVAEQITALCRFLITSLRPDRRLPHLGDDDGGRLLALDGLPGDDPRGLLYLIAVLHDCGECAFLSDAVSEEALWLLGSRALAAFVQIERHQPAVLSGFCEATGYAFLRSGWSRDDTYLSFDCGPHGWLNGGHAHADMLSVQVFAGGHLLIGDSGTFSYQAPWRDWFRGAEGHSIVRVDGDFPAEPAGLFQWKRVPELRSIRHQFDTRIEYVAGIMDAGSWRHHREIFFLKPDLIVLLDTISGGGHHEIEARFPLADRAWRLSGEVCASTLPERVCTIQQNTGVRSRTEFLDGWYSTCYGCRTESYTLVCGMHTRTPVTIATLIDVSGGDHLLRRERSGTGEHFVIGTRGDGCAIATVRSSGEGDAVCAAFVA